MSCHHDDRPKVVMVGFLDTKLAEHDYVRKLLEERGCEPVTIDTSLKATPDSAAPWISYTSQQVCEAADTSWNDVSQLRRVEGLEKMTKGAIKIVKKLSEEKAISGAIGFGGTTSTALICEVFRSLPIGLPKLCVTTVARGDVSSFIRETDITIMPSIVDVSGYLNAISERILLNAASAIAGMAQSYKLPTSTTEGKAESGRKSQKKRIAMTMFGLTTPCVTATCAALERLRPKISWEPVIFHASGAGGQSMERLIYEGWFDAVLDITTTELADDLCGGVLSAGPDRLTAAGRVGIPQVVSLGAIDMVNFGPRSTVPEKYNNEKQSPRTFHEHNAAVTLMRTSRKECLILGERMANKLKVSKGPVKLVIPLRGFSGIDCDCGPFWDSEADMKLIKVLRMDLKDSHVDITEIDCNINDKAAAVLLAESLIKVMEL